MIEITTVEEFDNIIANNNVALVKFDAEWCGPCKTMHTVMEELEKNVEGVAICEVDVEEVEELTTKFRVRNVPTTFIFKNGEMVEKIVGTHSESELREKIEKIFVIFNIDSRLFLVVLFVTWTHYKSM